MTEPRPFSRPNENDAINTYSAGKRALEKYLSHMEALIHATRAK